MSYEIRGQVDTGSKVWHPVTVISSGTKNYLMTKDLGTADKLDAFTAGGADSVRIIDYAADKIDVGSAFVISSVKDVTDAGSFLINVTTRPSSRMHVVPSTLSELEAEYQVWEAPTVTVTGTVLTPINRNRAATKTSLAVWHQDSLFGNSGTLLIKRHWGAAGKATAVGGENTGRNGFLLQSGTTYLFKLINETASNNQMTWVLDYHSHG